MINKREYYVLCLISENSLVDENIYSTEIKSLLKDKIIDYNISDSNSNTIFYSGYLITSYGLRTKEEFEYFSQKELREKETLALAKTAKKVSIISIIIAVLSVLIALISLIFN